MNSPEQVRRDLGLDETAERFDWTQGPFTAGLSFGTASSSTLPHIAQPTPLQATSIFEPTEVPRSIRQNTQRRISLQLPHRSESTPNLNQNSEPSTLADPTATTPNQGSNNNQPPVVASTSTGPINTQSIPPPYTGTVLPQFLQGNQPPAGAAPGGGPPAGGPPAGPPPGPPAGGAAMAQANPRFIKLYDFDKFKGTPEDRSYAPLFLQSVEDNLDANRNSGFFTDDNDRIKYALGNMIESAGHWASARRDKAKESTPPDFGTWDDFVKDFKRAFVTDDEERDSRAQLFKLKQTGDVTTYNNLFRTYASKAKITQFSALSEMYKNGLRGNILAKILQRETLPTTMEDTAAGKGYYTIALLTESVINRMKEQFGNWTPRGRIQRFNQRRDMGGNFGRTQINAIETNPFRTPNQNYQNRKPLPELLQQLQKEGKCFNCRQTGHISRYCPTRNQSTNNGRFNSPNSGRIRELSTTEYYDYNTGNQPAYGNETNTSSNNPFQSTPTGESEGTVSKIQKLIANLPVQQFNELFDNLEENMSSGSNGTEDFQ